VLAWPSGQKDYIKKASISSAFCYLFLAKFNIWVAAEAGRGWGNYIAQYTAIEKLTDRHLLSYNRHFPRYLFLRSFGSQHSPTKVHTMIINSWLNISPSRTEQKKLDALAC